MLRSLPENEGQADDAIYLTETLSIAEVESKFLFKVKPAGKAFRSYKFGYTVDNPSYEYMRYRILGEEAVGRSLRRSIRSNSVMASTTSRSNCEACTEKKGSQGSKACTAS